MVEPRQSAPSPKIALVLAGGAARGAYEVGVVQHVLHDVAKDLGREVPLDILCGTSVGAFNACGLAAHAAEGRSRGDRLAEIWTSLRVDELVRIDTSGILAMGKDLLRASSGGSRPVVESALLDSKGIERLLEKHIPFGDIGRHLQTGLLSALTVSTTHVRSGRTVVFVQRHDPGLPPWSHDPTILPRRAQIGLEHALASAAIPVVFKPIRIGGEYYCDGGLRQNVPLSPARRLGADGLLVVNPRFIRDSPPEEPSEASTDVFPGPLFVLGKALNALLLDRIDTDLARLQSINGILEAGIRRYGDDFVEQLNGAMGMPPGRKMRPMRTLMIRASQDIGMLCAEFVRSATFRARISGALGRIMRRLAEGDEKSEADLLSYLLFDGEFARQLIALGRADAKARHDELCRFLDETLHAPPVGSLPPEPRLKRPAPGRARLTLPPLPGHRGYDDPRSCLVHGPEPRADLLRQAPARPPARAPTARGRPHLVRPRGGRDVRGRDPGRGGRRRRGGRDVARARRGPRRPRAARAPGQARSGRRARGLRRDRRRVRRDGDPGRAPRA